MLCHYLGFQLDEKVWEHVFVYVLKSNLGRMRWWYMLWTLDRV